jgi:HPt (histidine-containing phosphotransfer) domain-containing protein
MLTVGAALVLACVAFLAYDIIAFRSAMRNDLAVLAELLKGLIAKRAVSVLDGAAVLARVEGDKRLLVGMAKLFLETYPKMLSVVREAVEIDDAKSLEQSAHAVKGSVGNFFARPAFEVALKLEIMGHQGDLTGAKEAYQLLNGQIERLQPALEALSRERGA